MAWPFTTWSCGADTVPRVNKSRTPAKTIVKQLRNVLPPWKRKQSLRPEENRVNNMTREAGTQAGNPTLGQKDVLIPCNLMLTVVDAIAFTD